MKTIEKYDLSDYPKGWIIGNFYPTLISNNGIEVGIKKFVKGESEPCHFQKQATEFTVVISGKITLGEIEAGAGTILRIPNNLHGKFLCLEDCILVVIKSPSSPEDKVLCEDGH